MAAYDEGLKINPSNQQIVAGIQNLQKDMQAGARPPRGGGGGMGDMFGGPEAEAKLKANPRIAKYF